MAVGQLVLVVEGGHLLPLAGGVVLHVAGARLIAPDLAKVVEQRGDGRRLHGVLHLVQLPHPLPGQVGLQAAEYVNAVLAQPPGVGPVVAGGGGGGEEVALVLQIVQQLGAALPVDVLGIDFDKLLFPWHGGPS